MAFKISAGLCALVGLCNLMRGVPNTGEVLFLTVFFLQLGSTHAQETLLAALPSPGPFNHPLTAPAWDSPQATA